MNVLQANKAYPSMDWDSFNDRFKNIKRRSRAFLVDGHEEKFGAKSSVCDALEKFGFCYASRNSNSSVIFFNPFSATVDNVLIESCFSAHWKTYFKGLDCVEAIVTDRGYRNIQRINDGIQIFDNLSYKYPQDTKDTRLLSLMLGNKYHQRSDKAKTVGAFSSVSDKFSFPFSLFRPGMVDHMEDPWDPTPEEFLFALVMEGVNASTKEEKDAVEQAQLLCERKD